MVTTDSLSVVTVMLIWFVNNGLALHDDPAYLSIRTVDPYDERSHEFVPLPETIDCEGNEYYEKVSTGRRTFPYPLNLYCLRNNPRFCIMYDLTGKIAGVQFSYVVADLTYNLTNPNYLDLEIWGIQLKSVRIYLTNPARLSSEGRRGASNETFEGLWTILNEKMVKYDRKCQPNSPVIGEFVMLGCIPGIGQFYAYHFDNYHPCKDTYFLYLVYDRGTLIAFGHAITGRVPQGPTLNVYSYPGRRTLQALFPYPPDCLRELQPYGHTAIGIAVVRDPWDVQCNECHCAGR